MPAKTKDVKIALKWKEAENNGAPITQYTVYRRTVREDGTSLNWIKIKEITDTSDRKVVVNLEKGKEYEFVVSATNSFGEGGKEEGKIRKIKVLGGRCIEYLSFFSNFYKSRHTVWHWTPSNGCIIRSISLLSVFTSPSPSVTLCTPKTKEKACISCNPLMHYCAMLSAILGHVVRNRAGVRQYNLSV